MLHPKVIEALEDILRRSQLIIEYTDNMTFEQFLDHQMVQDAVERNLMVIGIAAVRIRDIDSQFYDEFASLRPAVAVRYRLAHGYDDDINTDVLWRIIRESLPILIDKIQYEL